jgi:hypothetical protein
LHTLRLIGDGFLLGPASRRKAAVYVGERLFDTSMWKGRTASTA